MTKISAPVKTSWNHQCIRKVPSLVATVFLLFSWAQNSIQLYNSVSAVLTLPTWKAATYLPFVSIHTSQSRIFLSHFPDVFASFGNKLPCCWVTLGRRTFSSCLSLCGTSLTTLLRFAFWHSQTWKATLYFAEVGCQNIWTPEAEDQPAWKTFGQRRTQI